LLIVVPRAGRTLTTQSVLAVYAGKIPNWWMPDDVIVLEELPHTATGKVHKLTLRTRFAEHLIKN
jgi:fatty-acyl-CoA synthase